MYANFEIMENLTEGNKRVLYLIKHYANGNKARFADMTNSKPQTVNGWCTRKIGNYVFKKILDSFPNVNRAWLLTGIGLPFTDPSKEEQPLVYPQELIKDIETSPLPPNYASTKELTDIINRHIDTIDRLNSIIERQTETIANLIKNQAS